MATKKQKAAKRDKQDKETNGKIKTPVEEVKEPDNKTKDNKTKDNKTKDNKTKDNKTKEQDKKRKGK